MTSTACSDLPGRGAARPERRTAHRRVLARLVTALAAAALALGGAASAAVLAPGAASAHSVIVDMDPADGSSIDHGPQTVTLTFNEAISQNYAKMTVVGPDGNLWSRGEPTVDGDQVSVPVGDLGPVGTYTVAVQVTSADGHVVRYTRSFDLTQPGDGTPGPKADASAASPGGGDGSGDADADASGSGDSGDSGGAQWWWFAVPAVALFGGGLWFALRRPADD